PTGEELGAGRWQRDIWLDRTVVHETAEAIAEQMSRSARYRAQRLMRVLAGRLGGPPRPELDPHDAEHAGQGLEALHLPDPQAAVVAPLRAPDAAWRTRMSPAERARLRR